MRSKIIIVALGVGVLAMPFLVGAVGQFRGPSQLSSLPQAPLTSTGSVEDLVGTVLLWLFWGLMVLGVAMFLVGGYKYVTSRGEPEQVGSATKTLRYAAIAIVVGLIAAGIPYIIASFFQVQLGNL